MAMSSGSETSLAELPQPFEISTAVSNALSAEQSQAAGVAGGVIAKTEVGANDNANNNCSSRQGRSSSFPGYMPGYELQVGGMGLHRPGCSYSVGEAASDTFSAAQSPYYCPGPPNTPYPYYHHHPDATQYLYPLHHPHRSLQPPSLQPPALQTHYLPNPILHHQIQDQQPPPQQQSPHMDLEPWSDNATISICNSSSSLFDSQESIEQLDKFCKYIDSSGDDEEFIPDTKNGILSAEACEKEGCSMTGCSSGTGERVEALMMQKKRYKCFLSGSSCSEMLDSPPKKNLRAMSEYYSNRSSRDEMIARRGHSSTSQISRVYNALSYSERNWIVELDNVKMWRDFDKHGTEMVITKSGRRMFPTLAFKVSGLDPRETYSCKLHMVPADHRRYKYLQTEWVAVGRSDKKQIFCEYEHPDSPNSGSYWTDKIVAFKLVKLTNNKSTKAAEQIILNSMHKYIPYMKITCIKDGCTQSYSFAETSFIAVTAYQSNLVTKLKIDHNPYARAFRGASSAKGGQKPGGHYQQNGHKRASSYSTNGSTSRGDSHSRSSTPPNSPSCKKLRMIEHQDKQSNSTASMESGFESDPGMKKEPPCHPFGSSSSSLMTGWPEENNMWNPSSLIDGGNICGPYMDNARVALEYEVQDTNDGTVSEGEMLRALPDPNVDLGLSKVEAAIPIEDDVFF